MTPANLIAWVSCGEVWKSQQCKLLTSLHLANHLADFTEGSWAVVAHAFEYAPGGFTHVHYFFPLHEAVHSFRRLLYVHTVLLSGSNI
jgi:hypothetical protein